MGTYDGSIFHVSSAPFYGGASRAGCRLHQALMAIGQNSCWQQAREPELAVAEIEHLIQPVRAKWFGFRRRRFRKKLKRAFKGCDTLATSPFGWGDRGFFLSKELPTVYHFHWMAKFLDWPSALPALAWKCPVVWTLHDINPVAGLWHSMPFQEEETPRRMELDARVRRIKEQALKRIAPERLVFVAPSRWMLEQCQKSSITQRFVCRYIPNGINVERFTPLPVLAAKKALGIDLKVKVVGFISDSLKTRYKGFRILQAALENMHRIEAPFLLTAGNCDGNPAGRNQLNLGVLKEEGQLRLFYSACDVFVCPSLRDNLPNTVLEAMSCQTPVVAFNTGGISDMVRNNISGYLVRGHTAQSLAETLQHALKDDELEQLGFGARKLMNQEFSVELQAERYVQLYEDLLGGKLSKSG